MKPGEEVVLTSGKTYQTDQIEGGDLRGVKGIVVDEPEHRRGLVSGELEERVRVAPVGEPDAPAVLDVPVRRVRSRGIGGRVRNLTRRVFSRGVGRKKMTHQRERVRFRAVQGTTYKISEHLDANGDWVEDGREAV